MSIRRCVFLLTLIAVGVLHAPGRLAQAGDDWLPIDPAELKMTAEPTAPVAPSIFLYRQVDRDDQNSKEVHYARIKILTEEGRKNADVELPFVKGEERIDFIKARTIRPDGSIANFDGKIFEKTIVKAGGVKYLAKTFTLPDVQVGTIIEYRYTSSWTEYLVYDSRWILSAELFTMHAKFSLKPNEHFSLRWTWQLLPDGTQPPTKEGTTIRLEAYNIPAFQTEDFMPPENELKARVSFIYGASNRETEPDKFWKAEGKKQYEDVEGFVNKRKAMEQAASQIVSLSESPDAKLRKIYARVQQLRNTSFEKEKSEKEMKREKQKENNNVEDVWKNQSGEGGDLTWLFLGLVRGAGFEAYPVLVSRRNEYFFNPALMNPHQLDDIVVLVRSEGKDLYFDPGTEFTPYGYLPWAETSVRGLKLDKEGGSWVTTSIPTSSDSVVNRVADLKMTENGGLTGKLTVTYTGLEAARRRMQERNEDDVERKKYLEDEVKEWVPVSVEAELTNKPTWKSSADTLVAEFDFKADGWAAPAGRRALIPVGFFVAQDKHLFEHANRVHPLYFEFPFETRDDVKIDLPLGWTAKSLPPVKDNDQKVLAYFLKADDEKGVEHISRVLKVNLLGLDLKYYGALRNFIQDVKTSDDQQIVVQPGG